MVRAISGLGEVARAALLDEAAVLAGAVGGDVLEQHDGVVIGLRGRAAHVAEHGAPGRAPRPVLAPGAAGIGLAIVENLRERLGGR